MYFGWVISYRGFDDDQLAYEFLDWILVLINIALPVQAICYFVIENKITLASVNACIDRYYRRIYSKDIKRELGHHPKGVEEDEEGRFE